MTPEDCIVDAVEVCEPDLEKLVTPLGGAVPTVDDPDVGRLLVEVPVPVVDAVFFAADAVEPIEAEPPVVGEELDAAEEETLLLNET